MLSISQFKTLYAQIKENLRNKEGAYSLDKLDKISLLDKYNKLDKCDKSEKAVQVDLCCSFIDYFTSKFSETSKIFAKFDSEAVKQFCSFSHYVSLEEGEEVFKKGEFCEHYFFILFGDIDLFEEEGSKSGKLLKTVSAGNLYGHKIKSVFNYFAVTKNSAVFIKILKKDFDKIIEETNKRKIRFKSFFLKKFFPKLRIYSDDVLESLKPYFIREQYEKDSKILVDGEFDEFVYLVIKGDLAFTKSTRRIKNLQNSQRRWVILENISKGEVFGVFSALKHHKNNYTVRVMSDKAEVYKISKAHCLFYFGGSSGTIPEALKGIDSVQQVSINCKLDHLEYTPEQQISNLVQFIFTDSPEVARKKQIDESEIENSIKDAWKDLENLGSKISEFKSNLLKSKGSKPSVDIFAKCEAADVEMKDHTKLMGFATNRVVSKGMNKTGLSAVQLKGMNKLQSICGVKKPEEKKDAEDANNSALIQKLADKGEVPKHNKLTMELDEQVEKGSSIKNTANDAKSVNSISSNSTNSSNGISSTEGVNLSTVVNPTTSSETKKPAAKKAFSLKNLI